MHDGVLDVLPLDQANRTLLANTHPSDWVNPQPAPRYNLVVIGAGTAGLVSAAAAAGLGAKVALVERQLLGGDCLSVGCVPSKALLRAARAAADVRRADEFGVHVPQGVTIDFSAVMARMRRLRADLSEHDSATRFRSLGVDVFLGDARFTGSDTVDVGGKTLRFRRAIVATGARPARPETPGLAQAGYLTTENVFNLTELPRRLAVIGAGPVGSELAQAFARFGSEVHLLAKHPRLLPRDDPDAAAVVERSLTRDGVRFHAAFALERVQVAPTERILVGRDSEPIRVDAILVAVGRTPNVDGLNLEAAGVAFSRTGVTVDDRLQTSNRRVFAAGDVCSRFKFTHAADALARIAVRNALFFGRARASALTIPWCTYTDPELAHAGLDRRDAEARGIAIDTFTQEMATVDRALLDGDTDGFVKVHVKKGTDRIVGATIVARHAGEMISELTLAIAGGLGLKALSQTIHPYPTQAEALRKIGDAYQRTRLTPFVAGLLARWFRWTR
jgi:pyruvate/2-oxoglutarate dehydrogenase complex dihydrolipoamide dehydrogenase (E3) component